LSPPRDMIRISASEGHSFCRPVPSRNDLDLLVRASGAPAHTVTRLGYPLAAGQARIALHLRFPLWQQRSTSWKLAAARRQVELFFSLCSPLWRTAEQVSPQDDELHAHASVKRLPAEYAVSRLHEPDRRPKSNAGGLTPAWPHLAATAVR
jgi:hypothetical protein